MRTINGLISELSVCYFFNWILFSNSYYSLISNLYRELRTEGVLLLLFIATIGFLFNFNLILIYENTCLMKSADLVCTLIIVLTLCYFFKWLLFPNSFTSLIHTYIYTYVNRNIIKGILYRQFLRKSKTTSSSSCD